MTGCNTLSIELIKPTGEQAIDIFIHSSKYDSFNFFSLMIVYLIHKKVVRGALAVYCNASSH